MTHPEGHRTMIDRIRDWLFGPTRRVREAERRLEAAVRRRKIVRRELSAAK